MRRQVYYADCEGCGSQIEVGEAAYNGDADEIMCAECRGERAALLRVAAVLVAAGHRGGELGRHSTQLGRQALVIGAIEVYADRLGGGRWWYGVGLVGEGEDLAYTADLAAAVAVAGAAAVDERAA